MKISIEKKTLVGFGLATAVLFGINVLFYGSFSKQRKTADWVTHTYKVRENIESTLADIEEAESEQRGYVITGEERYLQFYYESVASIRQRLRDVKTVTADNPKQQQQISILKPLVEQRVAALWQVIDLRRGEGFDAAQASIKTGRGTELMVRIRQVLHEMENEEARLLKQRVSQQQAAIRTQNLFFSMGIVFNLVVFYWLYHSISREIFQRRQAQAALQRVNEKLEIKVEERTAALEQANQALSQEINAQKQSKAALRESYDLLRTVIDSSPHPIFVKDLQGCYQLMNIAGASRFNKQPSDIVGLKVSQLFSPEASAKFQADDQKILTTKQAETFEATVLINSEWRTYLTTRNVYCDSEGNVQGIVGFARDVTSLKQTQEALHQANEDLEKRVQTRTAELSEANAELARSNTELEQFAYVASHDLREPLRKIKSYTELLAEDYQSQFDEKAEKYMAYITDGAERMQALITDLLTYSRVGKGELSVEPTDLEAVVNRAIEDLSLTIKENDARITVKSLPTLKANPERMVQLFQNLIGNAIKYRGEAAPIILVQAELKDNHWVISVQDNGIGIKPQYFERIFAIFQRLHSRGKYPGTGIGLAICRKIVERHGGCIWVESQEGRGTTFFFTLPVLESL